MQLQAMPDTQEEIQLKQLTKLHNLSDEVVNSIVNAFSQIPNFHATEELKQYYLEKFKTHLRTNLTDVWTQNDVENLLEKPAGKALPTSLPEIENLYNAKFMKRNIEELEVRLDQLKKQNLKDLDTVKKTQGQVDDLLNNMDIKYGKKEQ